MLEEESKKRKQMHLKGFNYSSHEHVFFLTICTADKQSYFSDSKVADLIVKELEHRRDIQEIKLFCYCIMPDHLHLLLSLKEAYAEKRGAFGERTLQDWVSTFKRYTARMAGQRFEIKPLWQSNFYDHVVRKDESLVEICSYILNNQVRIGLVSRWEEYPYSRVVDDLPF